MYTKLIPFKDFNNKPRNQQISLNLTEREVFKLLAEFQSVFKWRDSLQNEGDRELTTEEVVEFYNNLERILLNSWGELSDDGLHFRKGSRYDFEESALFNATMVLFVSDPSEANKMLDGLMPKGMEDIVKNMDANLEKIESENQSDAALQAEIVQLRAQLANGRPDTQN